jgi:hypothetical protein
MKILIACISLLVVGLLIGWQFGQRHAGRSTTAAVQQLVEFTEASEYAEAARDARVISSIESGDTKEAVLLLSTSVAHYCNTYSGYVVKSEQRSNLLAIIDQMAKTNQVLRSLILETSRPQ